MTDNTQYPQYDPKAPRGPLGPKLSPRENAARWPKNAKLAIAAFCYHNCQGQEANNSHTTKVAIRDCKVTTCSLWPHRGWQKITGGLCKPRGARTKSST